MSDIFRFILTGSRGVDETALWVPSVDDVPVELLGDADREPRTLDQLLDGVAGIVARAGYDGLLLVHGDCPDGVDAVGDRWARSRRDLTNGRVQPEPHPAKWSQGRGAGFARNLDMVRPGAHLCFALIAPCAKRGCRKPNPHGSHGATHCADAADRADIPVQRFDLFVPAVPVGPPSTPSPTESKE